jgi:hypothetical protein
MSWLFMSPWLKFLFRRFYDNTLFWYFLNARDIGLRVLFSDLYLMVTGTFNLVMSPSKLVFFKLTEVYYWISSSTDVGFLQYRKSVIRDVILESL